MFIYDENGLIKEYTVVYSDMDNEWHRYLIDVSDIIGEVFIIFNGGYVDNTGNEKSSYEYSEIEFF